MQNESDFCDQEEDGRRAGVEIEETYLDREGSVTYKGRLFIGGATTRASRVPLSEPWRSMEENRGRPFQTGPMALEERSDLDQDSGLVRQTPFKTCSVCITVKVIDMPKDAWAVHSSPAGSNRAIHLDETRVSKKDHFRDTKAAATLPGMEVQRPGRRDD